MIYCTRALKKSIMDISPLFLSPCHKRDCFLPLLTPFLGPSDLCGQKAFFLFQKRTKRLFNRQ